ncbi:hypothetical protein GCM10009548_60360 [Streptomyces malaysiensis subsp. malaysiensis]|uniref:Uncharacterized protein n=1 Tax=Streptomyces malaysiensis TaxID=92644 RepID=A0ABX6VZC8_STRMQ|nr:MULTISPECIES: hypothetical protein [Streptomyces]QPI54061.1 hypothetical protein I1A49_03175 [Streptomyces solisilvae]UHH15442.1 hypothetical protein LUV23_03210 [Streptomyces sp. HNM0561]
MHIVERDGRKTRFTAHGTRLLEEAQQIVGTHDAALRRLMGEGPADAVGCDPALTTATIEAVRALLGFRDMAPRAV